MILNAEAGTKKIRGMSVHLVRDCSEFFLVMNFSVKSIYKREEIKSQYTSSLTLNLQNLEIQKYKNTKKYKVRA